MKVLIDTCVISELERPHANPRVRAQVSEIESERLFLSVITIGELTNGVSLLPDGQRKRDLASWVLGLEQDFESQILPIDVETARIWGDLSARARSSGIQVAVADGLIAATALRHGLYIMTRNTKPFVATGALIVDPWADERVTD